MYRYFAFGLNFASDFELPELGDADGQGEVDVAICIEPISNVSPTTAYLGMQISVTQKTSILVIPGVGRFCVRDGRRISVEPEATCAMDELHLFLLGSVFGALFYQRGYLPLHANAVVFQGAAFAFAGHSGAGKSTLAAYFQSRGFEVLCDDICVIYFEENGGCICWPGIRRLKLHADSLAAFGHNADKFARIAENLDKFNVPIVGLPLSGSFSLKRIYILSRYSESGLNERLQGSDALNAIVSNLYRRRLGELSTPGRMLDQVTRLLKQVEVFTAGRQWGLNCLKTEGLSLERHMTED